MPYARLNGCSCEPSVALISLALTGDARVRTEAAKSISERPALLTYLKCRTRRSRNTKRPGMVLANS